MSIESDRSPKAAERVAMLAALVDGDVPLAYRLALELLGYGVPFDDIVVDVLAPVQAELGRRWAVGDLGVADEHAASAAVEDLLVRLGATAERPDGPAVVIVSPEHDAHALGGRVVASALALEGFRVLYLGASVPATHLGDFLEMQEPFALALSCSVPTALVGAARSVGVAHELGIPVVAGGRALPSAERASRLGIDALAEAPADAVRILLSWELSPHDRLAVAPGPVAEHAALVRLGHALIAGAIDATTDADSTTAGHVEELRRVLQVLESSLLLQEPGLEAEHVQWLRATGPVHGFATADIDAALGALADAMDGDLQRAGAALRTALD
jgi:methanogenic corrinoid protein MtbC1